MSEPASLYFIRDLTPAESPRLALGAAVRAHAAGIDLMLMGHPFGRDGPPLRKARVAHCIIVVGRGRGRLTQLVLSVTLCVARHLLRPSDREGSKDRRGGKKSCRCSHFGLLRVG